MNIFSIFDKKKNLDDLAPLLIYFDLIPTSLFKIPILTVPMRVNKVLTGEPTLIVEPNYELIYSFMKKYNIYLNYEMYYKIGITNLINYAEKISKEKKNQCSNEDNIKEWFNNTISIKANIPTLVEDLNFLLIRFLELYKKQNILTQDNNLSQYKGVSLEYFNAIIKYFQKRLERNMIKLEHEGIIKNEKIYFSKRGKYFPRIIPVDVISKKKEQKEVMGFVPYLIYDDLIELCSYNKKLLIEESKTPLFNYFECNHKIINESDINGNIERFVDIFNLKKIDIFE